MRLHLFAGLLLILAACMVQGAETWRLVRSEQGIEVSVREVAGSPIAETRAVMKLQGVTLSAAVALIGDVAHLHEWIAYMDESRVLAEISPVERINYTRSYGSWPVADRDAVVRSKFNFDRDRGVVRVESHAEPDYLPVISGVVRIRTVTSSWTISRLADDEVEVCYQVHSEPGGKLPVWLVNRILHEQPYLTLLNMREQVTQPPYRAAYFAELEERVKR